MQARQSEEMANAQSFSIVCGHLKVMESNGLTRM